MKSILVDSSPLTTCFSEKNLCVSFVAVFLFSLVSLTQSQEQKDSESDHSNPAKVGELSLFYSCCNSAASQTPTRTAGGVGVE